MELSSPESVARPTPVGRRVLGFSVPMVLSLLAPVLVLPLVARQASTTEWAALGVGQAVGAVIGIVVAFGWPMVGPVEVARTTHEEVSHVFHESLVTRLVLLSAALPVAVLLAWPVAPGEVGLASATAWATATMGLSSHWIAVGLGRPGSIMLFEHLPRLVVMALAGLVIGAGGGLLLYPAAIAASSFVGVLLYARFAVRPVRRPGALGEHALRRLGSQLPAAATALTASVYSAGAVFLVGLAASVAETAELSSADRLYRVGLASVVVLSSGIQAWVVPVDQSEAWPRRERALLGHLALGVVGMAAFTVAAPPVGRWFFGSALGFDHWVSAGYGLTFLLVSVVTSLTQHVLVPEGDLRGTLVATAAGAVVGAPAILVLAHVAGATGGAFGLALGELVVLGCVARRVLAVRRANLARVAP